MQVGDLMVDLVRRIARRGERDIELTTREFDLLVFLMRHVGEIVTRKMLLEQVWDMHFDPQTNVVDVHMSRLRQAVDRGFEHPLIHTVRGAGYQLSQ
jgi:two-component system OmpR family response regulator